MGKQTRIDARIAELKALESRTTARLGELWALQATVDRELAEIKAIEARVNTRFKELHQFEEDMQRVAYGVSVTIYDMVQAVQIEHGALALNPEGKHILDFGKETKE